jgi:excisionase family DNA binding protein
MPERKKHRKRGTHIPKPFDRSTPLPQLLTIEQGAALLQKSKDGLRKMVQRGKIPAKRIGREYRFERSELEAYIENLPSAARAPVEIVDPPMQPMNGHHQELSAMDEPDVSSLADQPD